MTDHRDHEAIADHIQAALIGVSAVLNEAAGDGKQTHSPPFSQLESVEKYLRGALAALESRSKT